MPYLTSRYHLSLKAKRRKVIADDDDNEAGDVHGGSDPSQTSMKGRGAADDGDDDDDESVTILRRRPSKGKVVGDDDDDAVGSGEEQKEDDDDNDEDEEDEEDEEDDEDEDDDEEPLDGPMLYMRVDALRESAFARDEDEAAGGVGGAGATGVRKALAPAEALKVYIEMLARAHVEPDFVAQCADVALGRARGSSSSSSGGSGSLGASQGGSQTHPPALCVTVGQAREYLQAARQVRGRR